MTRKQPDQTGTSNAGVEFVTADFDGTDSGRARRRASLLSHPLKRSTATRLCRCSANGWSSTSSIFTVACSQDSPVRFLHYHAVVEEAINSSGMIYPPAPQSFHTKAYSRLPFNQIEGRFYAPIGDARVSIVDVATCRNSRFSADGEKQPQRKDLRHHRTRTDAFGNGHICRTPFGKKSASSIFQRDA